MVLKDKLQILTSKLDLVDSVFLLIDNYKNDLNECGIIILRTSDTIVFKWKYRKTIFYKHLDLVKEIFIKILPKCVFNFHEIEKIFLTHDKIISFIISYYGDKNE